MENNNMENNNMENNNMENEIKKNTLTDNNILTIKDYSITMRNITLLTGLSIILIIIFIVGPLKNTFIISFLGKTACILILLFVLYKNIMTTLDLQKNMKNYSNFKNEIKMNVVYSYVFSIFVFLLLLSVIRILFQSFYSSTIIPTI